MRALFLLFFIALTQILSAQVVSGLYAGTLVNDSTKKEQRYELALSEYRGKITGYSYTTFVRNDSLFYSVKRVKATRKGGQLVVEDDKMIANNFPESPAKGVHQTNYIQLGNEDTLRSANGTWQTNRTKVYYVLTGGVAMQLDNDSTHSSLIGHLKELNIIAQPRYDTRDVAQTKQKAPEKPATVQPENNKQKEATAKSTPVKAAKGSKIKTEESKTKPDVAKSNPAIEQPVAEPASFNPSNKSRTESIGQTKATNQPTVATAPKLPVVATYRERKKNQIQAIETISDSIQLALYDNGVIDGDSISVYMNGETIVAKTRLTATATKKSITLPNVEMIEIILVAENLGTIPPNTGLLVIKDGEKTYQVHFSADLQTNAAIIFKRKVK